MNDFFDSLKDIKKEMLKEQKTPIKQEVKKTVSKEEAIAHKEQALRDEFLKYTKNSDIKKL